MGWLLIGVLFTELQKKDEERETQERRVKALEELREQEQKEQEARKKRGQILLSMSIIWESVYFKIDFVSVSVEKIIFQCTWLL